ncbi:MAG: alkaline phosphatase family protein [Gemmatimonadaceae bacterium]|nr:alkaline phosphatase family protein [Gemmatimonadaceae bacterium]
MRRALWVLALLAATVGAQTTKTKNVVVIVIDGMRWQELFGGADSTLLTPRYGVTDTLGARRRWLRATAEDRRRIMMPFLWDTLAVRGAIWGAPGRGAMVRSTNGLKFSYPGYQEILAGFPDPRIDKNDFGPNPNATVFEWLAAKPAYRGRVAAVATWGVFRAIFRTPQSGVPVYAGYEPRLPEPRDDAGRELDAMYRTLPQFWGDNPLDALAVRAAHEVIRRQKPRVLFLGLGENDEWAHAGRYGEYLDAAQRADRAIGELWATMQTMKQYRDKTTFIIVADHGRGFGAEWTDHGRGVDGADRIWWAMIGPDTPALGVARAAEEIAQAQVAATVAWLLGEDYPRADPRAALPLKP